MKSQPLEKILGQHVVIENALACLRAPKANSVVITGPSGSGKTWMAEKVATEFGNSTVLIATGDLVRISEPYGPFERLTEERSRIESVAVGGARVAAGVGTTLVGFGGLGSKVFDWMITASSALQSQPPENLNEQEWKWLSKLRRLSQGKSVVLIVDNVHWWDDASIGLLEKITDKNSWPDDNFVRQLKFVIVKTVDPSQKDYTENRITRWIQQNNAQVIEWRKCTTAEFGAALTQFGAKGKFSEELLGKLYVISSGNLKLAQLIAGALSEGLTADQLLIEVNSLGLLRTLLAERFKSRDEAVEEIFTTLKSAALIGMYFYKAEAACLTSKKSEESRISWNLERARASGLIEILDEKIFFSHPVILDFIMRELSADEIRDLSGKLASCLRLLRPGDYRRQATLLFSSGQNEQAIEAIALDYLQVKRLGEIPKDVLPESTLEQLKRSPIWNFCEKMDAGYDLISNGHYVDARQLLSTIPEPIERGLALELAYVQALCKMESGQKELSEAVASELATYLEVEEEDVFPEITTRMRLLQQQALVLAGTIDAARQNSIALMSFLRKRAAIDIDARMKFHQILRKSNSIHNPFSARTHLLQAINFFKPNEGQLLPEFPLEYYRSLVNLSGVDIQLGNWEEACKSVQSAFDLVKANEHFSFPRPDVGLNNLNIARYRAGLDPIASSIEQQEFAANYDEAITDNFQHRSNLAGMLTIAEDYDRAESLLVELEKDFSNRRISEQYISFHLWSRRHVLCYLTQDWSGAQTQQAKLIQLLEEIDWPSKPALRLRFKLMQPLIDARQELKATEFDSYFIKNDPQGSGPSWPHFGRGVQFSELQFWSDS